MVRDARYDILFQPMKIGPVTAKNRFYQVPHCTGMGWRHPRMLAEMRGIKAEGGWGVVCTEFNSIHPSSDDLPHPSASLWNDSDIRAHALMTDKVHEHGSLAGAELWYGGARTANMFTREVSMALDSVPNQAGHPYQTRAMDKTDIRTLRHWHRKAALRARDAGFDIVYVYATHTYLLSNFLDPRINTRSDEYGGSLENRTRLVRELIEETKEAVGDRCAVAVRFAADERIGEDGVPIHGERRDMFAMMAEMPDLWDINIANYSVEMGNARYIAEGSLEPYMAFIKGLTSKPVVTVGRFTSPDTMVSQIRRGITDFIGAARPSIADPFLPKKIEEGRLEDIRECIGCNMCYSGDTIGIPIRCTQNPTMGEEWRKGWHPEDVPAAKTPSKVLVVGAGPAGLEAARVLGKRGYGVILAEASRELGGRITREAALPGLSEYARVRDYRVQALKALPNVEIFRESRLTAEDVFDLGVDHVAIATGARWRRDRFDGALYRAVATAAGEARLFTLDDITEGCLPEGPTLVYDEDGYYLGGVAAVKLRETGQDVIYCTPRDVVSDWAGKTTERWRVRSQLMRLGVKIELSHSLTEFDGQAARLVCEYSGDEKTVAVANVVMVTARKPDDALYHEILAKVDGNAEKLPFTLRRIGDCEAPAIVAASVYAGHRYGRELDAPPDADEPLIHDRVDIGARVVSATGSSEASAQYLELLTRYYEEEIEGIGWFAALADGMTDKAHAAKMQLLSDAEVYAAASIAPLLAKYDVTPRDRGELVASGAAQGKVDAAKGWHVLIQEMTATFPRFMLDFARLEALAPVEDLTLLKVLTAHEIAAIDFLDREMAGHEASTAPLIHYLKTGRAT